MNALSFLSSIFHNTKSRGDFWRRDSFDIDKLNPPVFSLILIEEPENSLSPHYLGRISNVLKKLLSKDTQALIATHAPSILRRVAPEKIRYLCLNSESRSTNIKTIILPEKKVKHTNLFEKRFKLSLKYTLHGLCCTNLSVKAFSAI
ncbi:AAA family ATPase [Acinetobacter haemolyticus]|uniref:AAA family ATPase n=1 Tax=Acinetobacter haemolyticus TaxID=29430 RepID=UPI002B40040A|nr:AAA family ATPase [Acinetobacter haemolyticus]